LPNLKPENLKIYFFYYQPGLKVPNEQGLKVGMFKL
jgi:hypothetical protein